jgi:hypothetical protein
MKSNHILVILFCISSLISCERDYESDFMDYDIYYNSFESALDIIGWYGINEHNIIEDAPETGGKKSLKISGGCIIPHAFYRITLQDACDVKLRCWGKGNGSIALQNKSKCNSIHISITESTWTSYIGENVLHCRKGDTLEIVLISGGFVPNSMLVDLVQITKVNPFAKSRAY